MTTTVGEGWVGVDITATPLNVTAGDVLALVQIGGSSTGDGSWGGNITGDYTAGARFTTLSSAPSGAWQDLNGDFGFRTFVDAVAIPVPAAVWLFGSSAPALWD